LPSLLSIRRSIPQSQTQAPTRVEKFSSSLDGASKFAEKHGWFLGTAGSILYAVYFAGSTLQKKDTALADLKGKLETQLAEKDTNLERAMRLLDEKNSSRTFDLIAHADYEHVRALIRKAEMADELEDELQVVKMKQEELEKKAIEKEKNQGKKEKKSQ
jgi:hypothetical protein